MKSLRGKRSRRNEAIIRGRTGKTVYLRITRPCSDLELSQDGCVEEDLRLNSRDWQCVTLCALLDHDNARMEDLSSWLIPTNPIPFAGNFDSSTTTRLETRTKESSN